MTSSAFEAILDDCLARLQAGEPLEYCLEDYPHLASELRPLLGVAGSVRELPPPPVNQIQIEAGLDQMLAQVHERHLAGRQRSFTASKPSFAQQIEAVLNALVKPALAGAMTLAALLFIAGWLYALRGGLPAPAATVAVATLPTMVPEIGPEDAPSRDAAAVPLLPPPQITTLEDPQAETAAAAGAPNTTDSSPLPQPDLAQSTPGLPGVAAPVPAGPIVADSRAACATSYFFSPAPEICPRFPAQDSTGARQAFEHGSMIWLPNGDLTGNALIYVFYDNGLYDVFIDSWHSSEPIADDSLVAPAGLNQPIRGFGKVWREQPGVAAALGWAINGESAVELIWQDQPPDEKGASRYIQLAEASVIQLSHALESGAWVVLP